MLETKIRLKKYKILHWKFLVVSSRHFIVKVLCVLINFWLRRTQIVHYCLRVQLNQNNTIIFLIKFRDKSFPKLQQKWHQNNVCVSPTKRPANMSQWEAMYRNHRWVNMKNMHFCLVLSIAHVFRISLKRFEIELKSTKCLIEIINETEKKTQSESKWQKKSVIAWQITYVCGPVRDFSYLIVRSFKHDCNTWTSTLA